MHIPRLAALTTALLLAPVVRAETAPFDLVGPTLRVSVTHDGTTLPIANVPQLATGDRITIKADFPTDQAARYLLVAAFLRGSTNPPPKDWFYQAESWTKKGRDGLSLTVPQGAQQIMLFLAPSTGGDFSTLRNAVQGKPGAFVRAAQDLAEASLDRRRLDAYLASVRKPVAGDNDRLERITPLLARTLQVKINTDCLTRTPELQAPCLLQNQDALVLNDGHTNAITDALAGPGVDLALQLSATPQGGLGYYSPYIAAARDIIGLFSSIHTAKYQYIPALARLDGDGMNLVLNSAPSFHNPKSVIVTALPIVAPVRVPPLQVVGQQVAICGRASEALLPVGGAPLVYATEYAHDLSLRTRLPDGRTIDLPARPDAEKGGLVITLGGRLPADPAGSYPAVLHGLWGFQPFDGPSVTIDATPPGKWQVAPGTFKAGAATLMLQGGASACVSSVATQGGGGQVRRLNYTIAGPNTIAVELPDGLAAIKDLALQVSGPAGSAPDSVALPEVPAPRGVPVSMIARHVELPSNPAPVRLTLGDEADIAGNATLTASLRSGGGQHFTGRETVEISAEGGSGTTAELTTAAGVTLADRDVLVIRLQPEKALGTSAYGRLRARIVRDKVAGDWLTLGTLVRLPDLRQLRCPDRASACELTGDRLFLIQSVSPTQGFEQPVLIPEGFPGNAIQVPRPADGTLFLRLHDDPDVVSRVSGRK
jgi:hypothetical protein